VGRPEFKWTILDFKQTQLLSRQVSFDLSLGFGHIQNECKASLPSAS